MPFHVEISTSLRHARAFNLDEAELQRTIVGPWLTGRPIKLGDREWEPASSTLKILEGTALDNPALSFGQGWANAERSARNVTQEVLEAGREALPPEPVALVIEADSAELAVAEMIDGYEARPVDLKSVRAWIDGRDPSIAAVILVRRK